MNSSRREILGLLLGLPLAGCVREVRPAPFESAPDRVSARREIDGLSDEYEALMGRHGELVFRAAASRSTALEPKFSSLRGEELALMSRAEELLEYHEALVPPPRARSWQLGALGMRLFGDLETLALERKLAAAQLGSVEVAGSSLSRAHADALMRSRRPDERDAGVGALEALHRRARPIARELLLRRRARARELGEDYYEAVLRTRRVQLARLEQLAQAFVRGTDAETRSLARALRRLQHRRGGRKRGQFAAHDLEFALDRLTPLPDAWFPAERALEVARGILSELGLDVAEAAPTELADATTFNCQVEIASVPVKIPEDVRLLTRRRRGFGGWAAMLEELARVTQLSRTREPEALLKGYPFVPGLADPAFDLGFARVFSRWLSYPEVLATRGKLPARNSARAAASLRRRALFELRRTVAWMTFERRALANPKQDLDRLAAQLYARLTGVNQPVFWAADPRLVACPGVGTSVLLGELFAADVHDWLRGESSDPRAAPPLILESGRRLAEVLLAGGVSRSIDEKLLGARGRRLSARPAVLQLTRYRVTPQRPIVL